MKLKKDIKGTPSHITTTTTAKKTSARKKGDKRECLISFSCLEFEGGMLFDHVGNIDPGMYFGLGHYWNQMYQQQHTAHEEMDFDVFSHLALSI